MVLKQKKYYHDGIACSFHNTRIINDVNIGGKYSQQSMPQTFLYHSYLHPLQFLMAADQQQLSFSPQFQSFVLEYPKLSFRQQPHPMVLEQQLLSFSH